MIRTSLSWQLHDVSVLVLATIAMYLAIYGTAQMQRPTRQPRVPACLVLASLHVLAFTLCASLHVLASALHASTRVSHQPYLCLSTHVML